MRFLVLSRNASLYSTSRITLAARARGHEVNVIDPLEFQIVVSRGRPSLLAGGAAVLRYDIVIPRIGASITNYGLAVVRQFDMMGIPVLNNAVAIARSRDKLRAMQLLTKKNIDVPVTVCARTPDGGTKVLLFAKDFHLDWPTPYILKDPVGLPKGSDLWITATYAAPPPPNSQARVTLSRIQKPIVP